MSNEQKKLIPIGRYKVRRISHDFGEAGTGTEQIGVMCEIVEGPYQGTMLSWYGSFTEAAEEFAIKGMRALGWQGNRIREGWDEPTDAIAVVEHEPERDENGRETNELRARIAWINSLGVAMKKKLDGAGLAALEKRLAGVAARIGGGGGDSGGGSRKLDDSREPSRGSGRDERPRDDRQRGFDPERDAREQQGRGNANANGRGSGRYNDDRGAPPPGDDDKPPFQRGRDRW